MADEAESKSARAEWLDQCISDTGKPLPVLANAPTFLRSVMPDHFAFDEMLCATMLMRPLKDGASGGRKVMPIAGTIAESYLRKARGYGGLIQPTLGFLPANERFPAALIAAYRLRDDPKCKITIGRGFVAPIMLAPTNDLLGLVLAQGVEDAVNAHGEASGLGAWAAGTATRLPALACLIPSYIECMTILVDDDDAGRINAQKLMYRLRDRDIEVRLTSCGNVS